MKVLVILNFMISGNIFFQDNIDRVIYEEKSVYFKEDKDKLILEDGRFFYGEFLEKSGKKITFHREFETSKDTFLTKDINLLVLANGKTIVRNRKTFRPICYGISIYFIFYFSLLDVF